MAFAVLVALSNFLHLVIRNSQDIYCRRPPPIDSQENSSNHNLEHHRSNSCRQPDVLAGDAS